MHTSIAGGLQISLERARALGCDTLQIFSHNPRGWALTPRSREEIDSFRTLAAQYAISPIFIHTSYLINLASANSELLQKSIEMVAEELNIADSIGADYVVLHTGSASDASPSESRKLAAASLSAVAARGKWRAGLLLENTAGQRGDITSGIGEIADIMDGVPEGLVSGICLDTCHAFAAGYDITSKKGIDSLASDIRGYIGKARLRLIHLNDSKGGCLSGVDRHEHIGKGKIGLEGFRRLLENPVFRGIPLILETPKKSEDDDPLNLRTVKRLLTKIERG